MRKRTRIIALISTLCFTLSLFVVGVLAVGTVSFNVTSSLNFTAEGVFVMLEGNIKQGTSTSQTSKSSIKGYSYKPVSDSDPTPNGAQTDKFVTSNGSSEATWSAGTDVTFTTTENVVKYEFTFTNYTETEVTVTRTTNIDELKTMFGSSNVAESTTGDITLPAYTGTTSPITYSITITLNDFTTSFTGEERQLEATFNFGKTLKASVVNDNSNAPDVIYNIYLNGASDAIPSTSFASLSVKKGDTISIQTLPTEIIALNVYLCNGENKNLIATLNNTTKSTTIPELQQGDYISIQARQLSAKIVNGNPAFETESIYYGININEEGPYFSYEFESLYIKEGDYLSVSIEWFVDGMSGAYIYVYNADGTEKQNLGYDNGATGVYIPKLEEGDYIYIVPEIRTP